MTDTTTTKRLLAAGVIATPLFFTVAFAQAFSRDGFDLSRHMLSQLAMGDLGWLQIANFIVTGTLFMAAAGGIVYTVLPQTNPELMSLLFAVASLIGWAWISTICIHLVITGTAETTAPRDLVRPS
ncbi:Protein of unknown function [Streptosporangium canum]|uniref:DUF998 domain-containing protein n=1 Tax=Streptosporangium canum TaxID=324952 RepID=A0A1I3G0V9_9ACTN|nr:DUF998 domain-containing protein [Streptosporangium canum]SFI17057.1 Protein of unknown function [Streptosporangium canum]